MDKRFFNIFNLTEDEAIALLQKPLNELENQSERYVAASHLINFPTERSIQALVDTIKDPNPEMYHRIARRKAVESLGRLKADSALPTIQSCLQDEDPYTVENAVWAIGEIGTDDQSILEDMANLLTKPEQNFRVIIHTLAKFGYQPATDRIKPFVDNEDESISSAAIATVARLTDDYSQMDKVVGFLHHTSVNARRACIQDLIDTEYYAAIPRMAQAPISMVFRLRGIRLLAAQGLPTGKIAFTDIEPSLDSIVRDHPQTLEMVHEYDQKPSLEFLIKELYHTDFGRCYLATQTLLTEEPKSVIQALINTYEEEACSDYGAHYHVVKLIGWLKYQPGKEIVLEALHNTQPQFQKSRAAAAIALANIGAKEAIPLLKENLNTSIFDLKYASLLALEQLGDTSGWQIAVNDEDLLIRTKAEWKLSNE